MKEQKIDEMLELIWTLWEGGRSRVSEVVKTFEGKGAKGTLNSMAKKGLISIKGGRVSLKEDGEDRARRIIRRHRLAERLLSEVFELDEEQVESQACRFEHILSPEVTESVCTFLGHPPTCPHGKPLPRGKCCIKSKTDLRPLLMPLSKLHPGEEGRIVFITPRYHARLDRLSSLGVVPGSVVKMHQTRPSYVIKIGETDLALDREIAREIYVKKI